MLRNTHIFQFNAAEIAQAARGQRDYHNKRMDFWHAQQKVATEKAKSAGLEVSEVPVTGGTRIDVHIDPNISARLSECASKIRAHREARDRYEIEAAAYTSQPPSLYYDLNPDDVVYFRLAGGPREE